MLQLISIVGALAVLAAFAADQFGWVDADRLSYALANLMGASILTVVAVVEGQVGFILLQGAWAVISVAGIARIARRGQGS
jgi:hypothetical protein